MCSFDHVSHKVAESHGNFPSNDFYIRNIYIKKSQWNQERHFILKIHLYLVLLFRRVTKKVWILNFDRVDYGSLFMNMAFTADHWIANIFRWPIFRTKNSILMNLIVSENFNLNSCWLNSVLMPSHPTANLWNLYATSYTSPTISHLLKER